MASLQPLIQDIARQRDECRYGRVSSVQGLLVEVAGLRDAAIVGAELSIATRSGGSLPVSVVGFREDKALCLPFGALDGVSVGSRAELASDSAALAPSLGWRGRVINGRGEPVDGKGRLPRGSGRRPVKASPPPAHARGRVGPKISLGVRALDVFAPCCEGQRMGIFAGSGVGKSVLMSMLARYTACDVAVVGLIGERGREVQEFIEDQLGEEGLARAVVVAATSDEPAVMRRQAAYMTLAVAEYFRDQGLHVLCMMDSVTRFAMAQREIGLACGEPPTTKGYTPTVFAELPRLLERAGPGPEGLGSITGLFTVLVDGDDHNEPIADAVRGILDGHIVMQRSIAERGRYPAINVLKSVSRTLPGAHDAEQYRLMQEARAHLAAYSDMEEMIRLGAYRRGTNPELDVAIQLNPALEAFLGQAASEQGTPEAAFNALADILAQAPVPA